MFVWLILFFIISHMKLYISYNLNEVIKELHNQWKHKERSGLLKVQKIKWAYIAYDIFFPKQSNSTAYTTFTWDINEELIPYLQAKNELHAYSDYAVWIHSHHSMNAFWSGTDRDTRKDFASWGCNEFMSVVTSYKKGTHELDWIFYNCTLDIFKPIDFEYDCEVILWIPWVSEVRTEETDQYKKYKNFLKEFRIHKNSLIETYCLPEDAFKEQVFNGKENQLFFHEPDEYKLDPKSKANELLLNEEAPVFRAYNGYHGNPFLDNSPTTTGKFVYNKHNKTKAPYSKNKWKQKTWLSLLNKTYSSHFAFYEPALDDQWELVSNEHWFYKTVYHVFEPLNKLDQYFNYIGEPNPFI